MRATRRKNFMAEEEEGRKDEMSRGAGGGKIYEKLIFQVIRS
jgi:hypothetical protein